MGAEVAPVFHRVTRAILRTPAEGADTVVWRAAAPCAREWTGRFFFDRSPRRTHVLSFTRETEEERRAFWQHCESWSGAAAPAGREIPR